jgi:hypothetical protein
MSDSTNWIERDRCKPWTILVQSLVGRTKTTRRDANFVHEQAQHFIISREQPVQRRMECLLVLCAGAVTSQAAVAKREL